MEGLGQMVGATHENDHDIAQVASGLEGVATARSRVPGGSAATHSHPATTKATLLNPLGLPENGILEGLADSVTFK